MTFTIKEVAADLKVQDETVYKLVREGKLEAFKIGNRYRFTEAALNKFKEKATNETMS